MINEDRVAVSRFLTTFPASYRPDNCYSLDKDSQPINTGKQRSSAISSVSDLLELRYLKFINRIGLGGELSHKDSMGNIETMVRGDIQMTSGGTGIRHSEFNDHKSQGTHFLQIWSLPFERGLTPKYYTR